MIEIIIIDISYYLYSSACAIVHPSQTQRENEMSNAKHTPGPWTDQFGMAGRPVVAAGNHAVDIAAMSLRGKSQDEAYANARLIAAAPELLEALEAIVRSAERNQAAINLPLLANASAAIAKARGQYRSAVGIEHGITQQIESDAAGEFPIAKARGE